MIGNPYIDYVSGTAAQIESYWGHQKLPIESWKKFTKKNCHKLEHKKNWRKTWKKNKCAHYSISHKKAYSIIEVAKMFKSKIKYLKSRKGERYSSALTKFSLNNRIIRKYGKIELKDYVSSFIKGKKL